MDHALGLLKSKGLIDEKTAMVIGELVSRGKTLEQAAVGGRYVSGVDFANAKGEFGKPKEISEEIGTRKRIIKGAPASRIVSVIMRHAVEGKASDIHIEPIGNESRVRYRIDGVLRTSFSLPIHVHPALVSRIKLLANLKIDETRIPQDGRITEDVNGKKIDFRVTTLPVVDNEKVVDRKSVV